MLSARLKKVASLVPNGARVVDVGTDHAYLPIYLIEQGVISSAIATDINKGPLAAARSNLAAAGITSVDTILCDGVEGIENFDSDCVIIAGMGGDTAAHIIDSADCLKNSNVFLIIQPMSSADSIRKYLAKNGFETEKEIAVADMGHIYPIITARYSGEIRKISPFEAAVGLVYKNLGSAESEYLKLVQTSYRKKATSIKNIENLRGDYLEALEIIKEIQNVLGEQNAI